MLIHGAGHQPQPQLLQGMILTSELEQEVIHDHTGQQWLIPCDSAAITVPSLAFSCFSLCTSGCMHNPSVNTLRGWFCSIPFGLHMCAPLQISRHTEFYVCSYGMHRATSLYAEMQFLTGGWSPDRRQRSIVVGQSTRGHNALWLATASQVNRASSWPCWQQLLSGACGRTCPLAGECLDV